MRGGKKKKNQLTDPPPPQLPNISLTANVFSLLMYTNSGYSIYCLKRDLEIWWTHYIFTQSCSQELINLTYNLGILNTCNQFKLFSHMHCCIFLLQMCFCIMSCNQNRKSLSNCKMNKSTQTERKITFREIIFFFFFPACYNVGNVSNSCSCSYLQNFQAQVFWNYQKKKKSFSILIKNEWTENRKCLIMTNIQCHNRAAIKWKLRYNCQQQ